MSKLEHYLRAISFFKMATLDDEYIVKSRKIYHRIGHNIVGNSNGSKDEKEVYMLNVTQKLPGNTIRNKYEPGYMGANGPFWTKHTVETFTPSSEEEFVAQKAGEDRKRAKMEAGKAANAEREKLRPQYEREFFQRKPKNNSEAVKRAARRRGWMPFEEWYDKKKNNKPMYSKAEERAAMVDFLQREAAERQRRRAAERERRRAAELRQYSRALELSITDEQKRRQRWRDFSNKYDTSSGSDTEDSSDDEHSHAHVRQPKLNFEPPDNKDTGNQPSGNQPDVNQPEWCAIA
tara:strand:+ start:394 stop:1266 length:873 start_codon:yes stop_codon:yes gene_type:complete